MPLDTSGFLLEGIRIASGNSQFTYPPRSVISNANDFNSSPGRADYVMFAGGQVEDASGMDIGDPALFFSWSRNNGSVSRFDYNSYLRRWDTLPGSAPEELGVISNTKRLIAPVPDLTAPESPYSLYIGFPIRLVTFSVTIVESSVDFNDPPVGSVQISHDKGELNFSSIDLVNQTYQNQKVYLTRQSFFDRSKSKGKIGVLPESSSESYSLFLNPIPGLGQLPRLRIGYRSYLVVTSVATESLLSPPVPGTAVFSYDTGKVLVSPNDIDAFPNSSVYYDGVVFGNNLLTRINAGQLPSLPPPSSIIIGSSTQLVGILDPNVNPILDPTVPSSWLSVASTRFSFFLTPTGETRRYYFQVTAGDSSSSTLPTPASGFVVVDSATGSVTMSRDDVIQFLGITLYFVDTLVLFEQGAAVQVFRSSVNGTGFSAESDFVEVYHIPEQVIQDGISQAPFVMLPTVPLINSALKVSVEQASGGGGTFVGELVDGTDPSLGGLGYILDLDNRQLKFSSRKEVTTVLPVSSQTIKLPDSVIISDGLEVSLNGSDIKPGIDFDFDQNSGLIEFINGIGEDDPRNILNISGTIQLPNIFISRQAVFSTSNVGMFLFISSGPNTGFHLINSVQNSETISVQSTFISAGQISADVRTEKEIIADRFWSKFSPPLKKISIYKKGSQDVQVRKLDDDEFSVIQTLGQINLSSSAKPGDKFQVSYVWQQSPDNGVTVTPTPKTDYATFKIRQEQGIVTLNSPVIKFNQSHNTVIVTAATPITLYVDNVTADPSSYSFKSPDMIVMGFPLGTSGVAPLVTIDYYVSEATGGETNFTLPYTPIDVDYPVILGRDAIASPYDVLDSSDVGDAPPSVFNGDQTSVLVSGGAILANDSQVFSIHSVSYDSSSDSTTVVFRSPPDTTVKNVTLASTDAISDSIIYLVTESSPSDTLEKGSTTLSIPGQKQYKQGMIFFVDGDPYRSISVSFNQKTGNTDVVISSPSTRNYILPEIQYTIRPVYESGGSFQTLQSAHVTTYPFTLVKSGETPVVFQRGVDFQVSEGGLVKLSAEIERGDLLEVMYVYRVTQPAGTTVVSNYSAQTTPNQTNGIQGQKLVLEYDLYSPDTFFFRRESVVTFIPEVVDEMKGSSTTGTSSGPNIASKSSPKPKDMGSPSLYFNEQHLENVDVVIARLLKFYNDLVNAWEDILSDLDGHIVGGTSGRFRFDGSLSNPPRISYSEITNDLDDKVKVYDTLELTGFYTFEEKPVYAHMYEPNSLSRIYSTATLAVAALNDKTDFTDLLSTMGSFKIRNLTGVGTLSAAPAVSEFTTVNGGSVLTIPQNGDPENLIPPFETGQKINTYKPDGSLDVSGTVLSATSTTVEISTPTNLRRGGIVQDVNDPTSTHFYTAGSDLNVDFSNGNIINFTLPPILSSFQNPIIGNEIIQSNLTFANTDMTPKRIPVLDGGLLTDSGRPSVPPLSRISENDLLSDELVYLSVVGNAKVAVDFVTLTTSFQLIAGSFIQFINGPNLGVFVQIAAVPAPTPTTAVIVFPPYLQVDLVGSDFVILQFGGETLISLYLSELGILQTNTESSPPLNAYIGNVNSELISIDSVILSFGQQQASGTGTITSSTVLTDLSANFALAIPQITSSSLLYVTSGPNQGLYKISAFTSNTVTVSADYPYTNFPSVGSAAPYLIIKPWSFISQKEPQFASFFLSKTLAFYNSSAVWVSSLSAGGVPGRIAVITSRQSDITEFIKSINGLFTTDDKLYDTRYLWIQQRTDKKNGTVFKINQAKSQRNEDAAKIAAGQKKLLIAQSLVL